MERIKLDTLDLVRIVGKLDLVEEVRNKGQHAENHAAEGKVLFMARRRFVVGIVLNLVERRALDHKVRLFFLYVH